VSAPTLSKYRTFCKQLQEYAASRGYVMLDRLTLADSDRFYASWKDGKHAKGKKLERFKAFTRFCVKRKWLSDNIAEDLKAPIGRSIPVQKAPFTDEELDRIRAACNLLSEQPQGPGYRNDRSRNPDQRDTNAGARQLGAGIGIRAFGVARVPR
jgi:site-specific recombinase XerD